MSATRKDPRWLTPLEARMLHAASLHHFGGRPGIRDEALLESALARPRQRWAYDESATLFDLAAAYAFGLIRNHAFVDGNKRVGLLAIRSFLFLNDYRFDPDQSETVTVIEDLARGTLTEAVLAQWIAVNATAR